MHPKNNPHNQASNTDKAHDPEKGATITDQQANAAREDQGKAPLPADSSHSLSSAETGTDFQHGVSAAQRGEPTTDNASDEFRRGYNSVPSSEHGRDIPATGDPQAVPPPSALVADPKPPTVNPASAKQISANLVQTHGEFSGFGAPNPDGKSEGTFTIHIVRQPNDSRSDNAILWAALQDEYSKFRQ